ncbi:MAG: hypothetical protein Q4C88_05840 [Akkermansia sp.]|nr:hypothetical protein [Akkermansia sp.]
MSLWKKLTKAVEKPFKEIGDGWWTDVRNYVGFGIIGGSLIEQQRTQKQMMQMEQAAAERAAQQQYNASLQPAATPEAAYSPALEAENYAADKRRRFSLSRTTMQRASLLGNSGTGRTTLG